MKPLLELKQVNFGYGSQLALEDINLHLHRGQFAALVGPSGAGKTTLLKLLLGILQPSHGEIYLHGELLGSRTAARIGYVPQLEGVEGMGAPGVAGQVRDRRKLRGRHRRRLERQQCARVRHDVTSRGDVAVSPATLAADATRHPTKRT